jgi:hypothetical protein
MGLADDIPALVSTFVAYVFSYLVAKYYKRAAYSSFNTSGETYRGARTEGCAEGGASSQPCITAFVEKSLKTH